MIKHAIALAILFMGVTVPFPAFKNGFHAEIETVQQNPEIIPAGKWINQSISPLPPPGCPVPITPGRQVISDVGCTVTGKLSGIPLNIYVLDDKNYQKFNNSQPCYKYYQLLQVNGTFNMTINFPNNTPDGEYEFFDGNGTLYRWWMIFDNSVGSSNVTLYMNNTLQFGHCGFMPDAGITPLVVAIIVITGFGISVAIVIGIRSWKRRPFHDSGSREIDKS